MFCKCFMLVTSKIKHYNIFTNVLQMFYFTCNNGLMHLIPSKRDHSLASYSRHVYLYDLPKTRMAHYAKPFLPHFR